MAVRNLAPAVVLSVVLAACATSPDPGPAADPVDSGPAQVLDRARTVANDLEDRQAQIKSQMRDPFEPLP